MAVTPCTLVSAVAIANRMFTACGAIDPPTSDICPFRHFGDQLQTLTPTREKILCGGVQAAKLNGILLVDD